MPESLETEVVVIGAGPGGYAAAFHAADLGLNVTLVDASPRLGGVCLLRGCIPSKALLHVAKLINETRESSAWGVTFAPPKVDLDRVRAWKNEVIEKMAGGIVTLGKARKITVIQARASFKDSSTLTLEAVKDGPAGIPAEIKFTHAIVATGSTPAIPKNLQIDDPRIMDSTGALDLPDVPKRLLVVGGGYIGLEMGTVYNALGSEVTVIEMTDGLLPGADRDLVKPLEKRLNGQFKSILLKTKVDALKPSKSGITAVVTNEAGEQNLEFDRVLIAVGRRPNGNGLGLENTKAIVDERGWIKVNRAMQTDDPQIFAIGDVAGEPMLAHVATREGLIAAEVIAGQRSEFDSVAIPAVVFTDPEIAWCGLTEAQAKAEGRAVKIGKFPWAASGRSATLGRSDGLTKLIVDPETERLLGVGLTGPGAGDLIAEGVLAVEMGSLAGDISGAIHAHPTLSETMMEAAESITGHSTHYYSGK